jgi:hypothetical protein
VAGSGVDLVPLAGGWTIAKTVVGSTQMGAALDDPPGDLGAFHMPEDYDMPS